MANTLKFGAGQWATKEGSTLAYNDENGNYKPLPFDFTRASNATVVNKAGLIETVGNGIPRIDFLGNTQGALKLEPQRTNLSPYSEDLNNFSTSNINVTINPNQITSPSGNLADKVEENNVDGSHAIRRLNGISVTAAQDYAFSFFAKKDERSIVGISNTIGGAARNAFIDIENGIILSSDFNDSSIDNYGNGWYKISLTDTATITSDYDIRIYTSTQDGDFSHQGVVGYGFYIWGISVEQGSYPTSYIPTQGSAVTRLADSCSQTVPDGVIGQTEGTLYTEINITKLLGATTRSIVRLGSAVDLVDFSFLGTLNNSIRAVIRTSANTRFQAVFEIQSVGVYKLAIGYKSNDSVFYVNGVQINNTINTSFTIPSIEDITYDYSTELNDSVNQTKVYNTRLTNSELQALTS